jgi:hypothetical protein
VFDLELTLPGMARSGLTHHAFAVSSPEHIEMHAVVVLVSTTTGSRNQVRLPFACYIDKPNVYTHEEGRPFEIDRPITPTQLGTIAVSELPQRVGLVGPDFFTGAGCTKMFGAHDVLQVQLQLPDRMASLAKVYAKPRDVAAEALDRPVPVRRLSIWSVTGSVTPWVIVSNDKSNLLTGFLNALELVMSPPAGNPSRLDPGDITLPGGPYWLGVRLAMLGKGPATTANPGMIERQLGDSTASGRHRIDEHLLAILGLT